LSLGGKFDPLTQRQASQVGEARAFKAVVEIRTLGDSQRYSVGGVVD